MEGSVWHSGRDRAAAAVTLWGVQAIEMEGQIYDKTRDGDVNASWRQEVCGSLYLPQATAAGLDQATSSLFILLHVFLLVQMSGWENRVKPVGNMHHGIWDIEI